MPIIISERINLNLRIIVKFLKKLMLVGFIE